MQIDQARQVRWEAPATTGAESNQRPVATGIGGRLRRLLVWTALTLLAALAFALAMVLASLAVAPDADPAPTSKPPMQFGPSGGNAPRPQ